MIISEPGEIEIYRPKVQQHYVNQGTSTIPFRLCISKITVNIFPTSLNTLQTLRKWNR